MQRATQGHDGRVAAAAIDGLRSLYEDCALADVQCAAPQTPRQGLEVGRRQPLGHPRRADGHAP
jgi:hypothetical protein